MEFVVLNSSDTMLNDKTEASIILCLLLFSSEIYVSSIMGGFLELSHIPKFNDEKMRILLLKKTYLSINKELIKEETIQLMDSYLRLHYKRGKSEREVVRYKMIQELLVKMENDITVFFTNILRQYKLQEAKPFCYSAFEAKDIEKIITGNTFFAEKNFHTKQLNIFLDMMIGVNNIPVLPIAINSMAQFIELNNEEEIEINKNKINIGIVKLFSVIDPTFYYYYHFKQIRNNSSELLILFNELLSVLSKDLKKLEYNPKEPGPIKNIIAKYGLEEIKKVYSLMLTEDPFTKSIKEEFQPHECDVFLGICLSKDLITLYNKLGIISERLLPYAIEAECVNPDFPKSTPIIIVDTTKLNNE